MSKLHPTPWEFEEHELSDGPSCIVYDARGVGISRLDHLDRETAAEIVRGVNALAASPAAALAEALRPFAACVEMIEQECGYADELDDVNELPEEIATSLTVGEVRAAHRVLAAWDAAQGGKIVADEPLTLAIKLRAVEGLIVLAASDNTVFSEEAGRWLMGVRERLAREAAQSGKG